MDDTTTALPSGEDGNGDIVFNENCVNKLAYTVTPRLCFLVTPTNSPTAKASQEFDSLPLDRYAKVPESPLASRRPRPTVQLPSPPSTIRTGTSLLAITSETDGDFDKDLDIRGADALQNLEGRFNTLRKPGSIQQDWWAFVMKPHIFDILSDEDLTERIGDSTPFKYLMYNPMQNLAPEEQIRFISLSLDSGFLSQSTFIEFAANPPLRSRSSSSVGSYCREQLRLAKLLVVLAGAVQFQITSVFAAMRFQPQNATPPDIVSESKGKPFGTDEFVCLDKLAFSVVKGEWTRLQWPTRDLAAYYTAFKEAAETVRQFGVTTCFTRTITFLKSCDGGPENWNLAQIATTDFPSLIAKSPEVEVDL